MEGTNASGPVISPPDASFCTRMVSNILESAPSSYSTRDNSIMSRYVVSFFIWIIFRKVPLLVIKLISLHLIFILFIFNAY